MLPGEASGLTRLRPSPLRALDPDLSVIHHHDQTVASPMLIAELTFAKVMGDLQWRLVTSFALVESHLASGPLFGPLQPP